jgi:hypothetical protein
VIDVDRSIYTAGCCPQGWGPGPWDDEEWQGLDLYWRSGDLRAWSPELYPLGGRR